RHAASAISASDRKADALKRTALREQPRIALVPLLTGHSRAANPSFAKPDSAGASCCKAAEAVLSCHRGLVFLVRPAALRASLARGGLRHLTCRPGAGAWRPDPRRALCPASARLAAARQR